MQYLSFCNLDMPLCLVSGLSYTKRARAIDHAGGYQSARGFETAEMSVRLTLNRSVCDAYGLRFFDLYNTLYGIEAEKTGASSVVYIGGYPIYPELNFAVTNINKTIVTDDTDKRPHSIECDITLQGVSCVKEVSRERALTFNADEVYKMPKVTLKCGGKSLEIQDDSSISMFNTTPSTVNLSINISQDDYTVERKGFLQDVIDKGGTVTCDYPQGSVIYNIISADLVDNELNVSGTIYMPEAYRVRMKTFDDDDIGSIIKDICAFGKINADVRISGPVSHYIQSGNALESIIELQNSAGFILSQRTDKIIFSWLPDVLNPDVDLDVSVEGDNKHENVGKVVWFDNLHETEEGSDEGETLRVKSCFNSDDTKFVKNVLKKARYDQNILTVSDDLNDKIWTHSMITILSNGEKIPVMVDYFEFDWVSNVMSLECKGV